MREETPLGREEAALIRMEGVSFAYGEEGGEWALRGIDLAIRRGERLAILGANGSGKSTLAKLMNALLLPTAGVVRVKGMDTRDPAHLWSVRQAVGMVFQNPENQMVAPTVADDVAFGPENLGIPPDGIEERVDGALRAVGMEGFRDRAPHQLSGGQKQRVAIAGVLAMRPDCLVLDEATAMLDPRGRREVHEAVARLRRERGMAVVTITHFMDEAAGADRIVVLDRGRIALEGRPREVFGRVDRLRDLGLDVPAVAELASTLREAGWPLPPDVVEPEELVDALWGLRSSG